MIVTCRRRCICDQCRYRWTSTAKATPTSCPKCKSSAWNGIIPQVRDPMNKALGEVQRIFANLAKSMNVAKLKKGRELTKARTGRCEGRKPFGEDPKLPAESKVLIDILSKSSVGLRPKDIAAMLNSSGLPSRSGKPWTGSTVAKMLRRHRMTQQITPPLRPTP